MYLLLSRKQCTPTLVFSLTVSKQFNRVAKDIDFDWLILVHNPYGNYTSFRYDVTEQQKKQEALLDPTKKAALSRRRLPYLADEPKKMLKTLTMCNCSLPVIRTKIDSFMAKNYLVYRTKASGKVYKGFVGIRKLKTMKIQPKNLDDQFKAMLKQHELLNKKRLALSIELLMHMLKNINRATLFVVDVDIKRKLLFIDHLNILNVRLSRRPTFFSAIFGAECL